MTKLVLAYDGNPMRHRLGMVSGLSNKKSKRLYQEARIKAKRLVLMMEEEGRLSEASVVPGTDEDKAKKALVELGVIAFGPGTVRDKLVALKTILEFCKEKPATKNKVTLDKSEEWLAAVEADMKKEKP